MIKNFIYILKRFKTSSVLNILGLSVAFAVFSIAMIQVHYDISYDRSFKQSKSIYLFAGVSKSNDRLRSGVSIPMTHQIVNRFPEIKAACILDYEGKKLFKLQDRNDYFSFTFGRTDEGFLKVFTPEIISGDAQKAFTEKNNILLTADVAKTLFGTKNPVGQTIWRDTVAYAVVAVCKPFSSNCSLQNGIYTSVLSAWDYDCAGCYNYEGFFLIQPENISSLQKKLNQPEILDIAYSKRMDIIPLTERYFNHELKSVAWESKGNPATTWSLMAIGILIMLIACINFMNFSMAMIPSRVRGMNIQKVLGIDLRRLQFWVASEAPCFAIVSFLIALVLIILFKELHLNDFFPADVSLEKNIPILLVVFFTGIVFSTLFGLYPAFRVTSFQPAMALSGSFSQSKGSAYLRNVLITIQFFAAIALICIAGFIKIQHDYMTNYSWGIQKENVTYMPIQSEKTIDITAFENEIRKNPSVTGCTASYDLPGSIAQNWGMDVDGKQIGFAAWIVRHDFPEFFGIHVKEGRDFIPDDDGKSRVICNQKFLKEYDYAYNSGMKLSKMDIVGVSEDFHFESLHTAIRPLCLVTQNVSYFYPYYFYAKIQGENTLKTIEYLKNAWGKLSDKPFDLHFLDDTLDNLYKTENNLAKLISIFGLIAVVIAVMGVYGLIVFNARYKAKEIAIRKVNGSTVREIMLMLNKNVLMQLGIAFVIAVPVAWYATKKWLENFAYKIPIHWWVFLLGGLIVLIITLLTVSAQSYRAATLNPTKALNSE